MKMNRLTRSLFVAILLLICGRMIAAPKETPPAGMGKYVIVLWEPGTPIPDDPDKRVMKRVEEPDVAKSGGKLLAKKNNLRLVYLPFAAVKQLQKHEAVSYIQRIWVGESTENSDERFSAGNGPRLATDSDIDLEWGPKTYSYDASGNIKRIGVDEYTYDSAGRLIRSVVSGKTETFKYDAFGNLTEKTIAGANADVIPVDPSSNRLVGPEYDAAGNMTTDGRRQYEYDSLNALTYTTSIGGTHRILYDANDERIGTLVGWLLSRWTIRDFEGQIVREYRGDGNFGPSPLWIWEQDHVRGEGQLLGGETQEWWYNDTGTRRYGGLRHYHLDHLGSVRMVTNKDGRSLSENDYYAFGATLTKTHQEQINSGDPHMDGMRFAGHWRDFLGYPGAETNEYIDYMHARNYDPNLGRFLSVDPVKGRSNQPQSWNRYTYAWNTPINLTDPDGRAVRLIRDKTGFRFAKDDNDNGIDDEAEGGDPNTNTQSLMGGSSELINVGKVDRVMTATLGIINNIGITLLETFAPGFGGKAKSRAAGGGIRVSAKGLAIVEKHLARFGYVPENSAMLRRLRKALETGEKVTSADANFYLHELAESTMMNRGMGYDAAHAAALQKYGASPFSLYHPEVIREFPGAFGNAWRKYWGLP